MHMAKSRILKELANNEVTLEVALKRLMVIANDISNTELKNWASRELRGYGDNDELPSYRRIASGNLVYSGINGNFQVTKVPLSYAAFPSEYQDMLLRPLEVKDSIAKIEIAASNKEAVATNLSWLANILYEIQGIQAFSIYNLYYPMQFKGILDYLATSLLEIYIVLDKELGNLDELDIRTEDVDLKKLNEATHSIINIDASGTGININVAGDNSTNTTQLIMANTTRDKMLELLSTMSNISEQFEDEEIKADVKGYLSYIETEVKSTACDKSKVNRLIRGIKKTLEPIKGFNAYLTFSSHLENLIQLLAAASPL